MKTIGITGNPGSGKSTVARIFNTLGIPHFNADEAGHRVYEYPEIRSEVVALLGSEAYDAEGHHRRKFIADSVFDHPVLLQALSAIIHPAVQNDFQMWRERQTSHYVLKEAAILFEVGTHLTTHGVILVKAPKQLRLLRTVERSGWSEKEFELREARQWTEEKKETLSRWCIHNDEQKALIPQVLDVHRQILEL